MLYVTNMEFLSVRPIFTMLNESRDRQCQIYKFVIKDAIPSLPPAAYKHEIKDLSALAEFYILLHLQPELACEEKKLLVIDLSNYPFITTYFDYRDHSLLLVENDKFMQDVAKAWLEQQPGKLPTILVNTNIPHTGLKIVNTSVNSKM